MLAHWARACPKVGQGAFLELRLSLQKFSAPKNKGIYEEKRVIFEKVWKIAFWLAAGPGHAQKWPKE